MKTQIELHEVICSKPNGTGQAYGVTFASEAEAEDYASIMQAAKYNVSRSPAFYTQESTLAAIEETAAYFKDDNLLKIAKA